MSEGTPETSGFAHEDDAEDSATDEQSNGSGGGRAAGCLAGIAIALVPFIALSFNGSSPNGFGLVTILPVFVILGGIIGIASLVNGREK